MYQIIYVLSVDGFSKLALARALLMMFTVVLLMCVHMQEFVLALSVELCFFCCLCCVLLCSSILRRLLFGVTEILVDFFWMSHHGLCCMHYCLKNRSILSVQVLMSKKQIRSCRNLSTYSLLINFD